MWKHRISHKTSLFIAFIEIEKKTPHNLTMIYWKYKTRKKIVTHLCVAVEHAASTLLWLTCHKSLQTLGTTQGTVLVHWLGLHPDIHLPIKSAPSSAHSLITLQPAGDWEPISVTSTMPGTLFCCVNEESFYVSFFIPCISKGSQCYHTPIPDGAECVNILSHIHLVLLFIARLWHQRKSVWPTSAVNPGTKLAGHMLAVGQLIDGSSCCKFAMTYTPLISALAHILLLNMQVTQKQTSCP